MKLDGGVFRYLTKEDIRVLVAVEMGMRNHELVPATLIESIASLKRGGTFKVLMQLLKYKLLHHETKQYDGYYLTYQGYDVLAIHTFVQRGHIVGLGNMIGTGKESDIYICQTSTGEPLVLKLARLGRMSFRAVKSKRDYLKYRSKNNWLYLSRLAAIKEYSYMQILHAHEFPTPRPVDQNRHAILMSLVPGFPLQQVTEIAHPEKVFTKLMHLLIRFAEHGLIHGDFNEFNILVNEAEEVFVIDFPQMVSVEHLNADFFFGRDVTTLVEFFRRRSGITFEDTPRLADIAVEVRLDKEVKASGYVSKQLTREEIQDLDEIQPEEEHGETAEGEAADDFEESEEPETVEMQESPETEENKEVGIDQNPESASSGPEEETSGPERQDIKERVKKQLEKATRRPLKFKSKNAKVTEF
jgi:RIO kinase 2